MLLRNLTQRFGWLISLPEEQLKSNGWAFKKKEVMIYGGRAWLPNIDR